eukprot:7183277-Pyramimonas_sp.AAC.1
MQAISDLVAQAIAKIIKNASSPKPRAPTGSSQKCARVLRDGPRIANLATDAPLGASSTRRARDRSCSGANPPGRPERRARLRA